MRKRKRNLYRCVFLRMEKESRHNLLKIIKNEYLFSIITRILVIGIGFVESILVARFLGASLKGQSGYINSIVSIGYVIVTFGIHQAYPYFKKKDGKEVVFDKYMSFTYLIFFLYFVVSVCLSLSLYSVVGSELSFSILLIPLYGFAQVLEYVFLIENPNRRNVLWLIVCVINVFVCLLFTFFLKANFLLMVLLLALPPLLRIFFFAPMLKFKFAINKGVFSFGGKMMAFGFVPMIALLMTTLNYRIDTLMLKEYPFITNEMIGVYSLGISLAEKIVLIPDTLKGNLASRLSRGSGPEEVAKVARVSFWATVLLCALVLATGWFLIPLFYGDEYTGAYPVIAISAAGAIFIGYFKLIAQYNIINKKQILNVLLLAVAIIVNVVGNLAFVPFLGVYGAAISTCIGHFLCGLIFIIYFCKKANIKLSEMLFLQKNDLRFVSNVFRRRSDGYDN